MGSRSTATAADVVKNSTSATGRSNCNRIHPEAEDSQHHSTHTSAFASIAGTGPPSSTAASTTFIAVDWSNSRFAEDRPRPHTSSSPAAWQQQQQHYLSNSMAIVLEAASCYELRKEERRFACSRDVYVSFF